MILHSSLYKLRVFTLIELLVVVAIISILAGIAVVNLLESQTRAKVSRVQSDLRTVSTGIELYRVDHNTYPTYHYTANENAENNFSFHLGGEMTGIFESPEFNGANPITTPIPYLNTMPPDAFSKKNDNHPETGQPWYVNWDYAIPRISEGYGMVFNDLRMTQGSWRIHSSGPDGKGPDTIVGIGQIAYDATNGTNSRGDVLRSQKMGQI